MSFILLNNRTTCTARRAGRELCRGLGSITISQLALLMSIVERAEWMQP